ncbi:ECF transporter S component [Lactobacillus hominis]|uniref:ECF transporter S component n=1 Tax=Lactobacillus hominis TaxID=1203033 RepID=UPI0023F52AD9|nr:ECF transporter S component [Lactobacillus hominis]
MNRKLHVKDIILITLIAIIFGFIYVASDNIYNFLTLALTPIGYGPLANDITMGIWCMAGPLAGFIVRLPGAAFLGEFLGACVETFAMAQWGAANFLSGFIQGLGNELGFTLTGYKHYGWFTLFLSATTTTIVTYLYDFFKNGYNQFSIFNMILYFVVRWASMLIFTCVLVKLIINLLERAHVINLQTTHD